MNLRAAINSLRQLGRDISTRTKLVVLLFALTGLLLIALSTALPHAGCGGYFRDLFREVGVVILTVFTVSMLYELVVEEKYAEQFLGRLRDQLQQGESNAAACAQMGILEMFPNRATFETKYGFSEWVGALGTEGRLRVMARSLFFLMCKFGELRTAIQRGATVELCLFDPEGPEEVVEVLSDLELFDVKAAISVFQKKIAEWVKEEKPPGAVELRCHRVHLFDSFTLLESSHFINGSSLSTVGNFG